MVFSLNSAFFSQDMVNVGKSQVKKKKSRLDQRLLTKYLTKLPGLPSRLGSLRGSRVPAHLKKHKQSHVYTKPKSRLQSCRSQVCSFQINGHSLLCDGQALEDCPFKPCSLKPWECGSSSCSEDNSRSNYQSWKLGELHLSAQHLHESPHLYHTCDKPWQDTDLHSTEVFTGGLTAPDLWLLLPSELREERF